MGCQDMVFPPSFPSLSLSFLLCQGHEGQGAGHSTMNLERPGLQVDNQTQPPTARNEEIFPQTLGENTSTLVAKARWLVAWLVALAGPFIVIVLAMELGAGSGPCGPSRDVHITCSSGQVPSTPGMVARAFAVMALREEDLPRHPWVGTWGSRAWCRGRKMSECVDSAEWKEASGRDWAPRERSPAAA